MNYEDAHNIVEVQEIADLEKFPILKLWNFSQLLVEMILYK